MKQEEKDLRDDLQGEPKLNPEFKKRWLGERGVCSLFNASRP